MSTAAVQTHTPATPMNLGNAFDLALPLSSRGDTLMAILELAAHLTIEREEKEFPNGENPYRDPAFREQEVKRRTLKGITDLRQITNMLELEWAIKNGNQRWTDADGAETSLLEVLEEQMPGEEQRKSSGRARQVWSFLDTAQAFREQGFSDQEIAACAKSGLSSALGITAAAQRRLAEVTPEEDLERVYGELIEAASDTTNLDSLRKRIRTLIDPTDTPPPPIPYSVEADSERCWVVMRPTECQFTELILNRLKDVLEQDGQLPQDFVRYWQSFIGVPVGQEG